MSISLSKYVDIVSGVAGNIGVPQRDLIGRLITINPLVPPQSFLEITTLAEVASYFGSTSEEYLRAVPYFGYISKTFNTPQVISYARWTNTATAPLIFGASLTQSLIQLQAITAGAMTITIGGVAAVLTAINLSAATDFADIATILQTAIRADGTGIQFTSSTVAFSSETNAFSFTGGDDTVAAVLTVTRGATNDMSAAIGWYPNAPGAAIWSNGSLAETITDTLNATSTASNNFGTYLFTNSCLLSQSQITESATWNNAQNILYEYVIPCIAASYTDLITALTGLGGYSLTLAPISTEYPEMSSMILKASTDYTQRNATQNYMYQVFPWTPSVSDTTLSNTYDAAGVNYYGVTQTAGQQYAFYQRGVMGTNATSPRDQNVYANEQWLKTAMESTILQLLLNVPQLGTNNAARSILLAELQSVITAALFNGVISPNKPLTQLQISLITSITGDPNAYFQVGGIGYWLNVTMIPSTNSAEYTLVYSKSDVVRSVSGTHILI